jgi:hypothetical protein
MADQLINDKLDGYYDDILPNHMLQRYDLDVGQAYIIDEYMRAGFQYGKDQN